MKSVPESLELDMKQDIVSNSLEEHTIQTVRYKQIMPCKKKIPILGRKKRFQMALR